MQIATRQAPYAENPGLASGMAVVVRSGDPLKAVKDLRGRKVAVEDPDRFTTWTAFQGIADKAGLDLEALRRDAVFTRYKKPDPIELLRRGSVDAAVVPTCQLERLESTGAVEPQLLRVLQPVSDVEIPCRSTSQLFPDTVFGATPRIRHSAVKALQVATLTMPPTANGYGWGIANDFHGVDELYRQLRAGPYSYLKEANWGVLWSRYRVLFFAGLALIAFLVLHVVRSGWLVDKRTRELRLAIEAQKASELQANEAQERLARMERAEVVSEMGAMLVHELRQPLATLMAYAGGLEMHAAKHNPGDAVLVTAARNILAEADRVSQIVERVRQYAKSKRHPRVSVRVQELLERAALTFSHSRAAAGVSVRRPYLLRRDCEDLVIEAEPLEVELALVNLMKNGAVSMHELPEAERVLVIDGELAAGAVSLSVTDGGPRISPERFAELARPVQSLKQSGLGLGLTIVKRVAENHGGSLRFRQLEGDGIRAELLLPCPGGSPAC
ncbi:MAG: PhnD/SsuA/transferrin family substrate-binding protein [Duodenibacillus sp.]|nr:PhnD/SsuA/transferrin family substrate-binding protein [Duodenibacillus sp.]